MFTLEERQALRDHVWAMGLDEFDTNIQKVDTPKWKQDIKLKKVNTGMALKDSGKLLKGWGATPPPPPPAASASAAVPAPRPKV